MADFGRQLADMVQGQEAPTQQPQSPRIARLLDADRLKKLEAALTVGSGIAASVPAGLAGMAQMIPTRGRTPSVNKAAETVENVQGALTYMPRTEQGMQALERTGQVMEKLGAPAEYLGEKTLQATGSPAAATAVNVLGDPLNFIGVPGSGKAAVAAGKAVGRAAMAAPRVAGDILSEALTPASRFESQRGAIKMKGGNWFAGDVESELAPLKSETTAGETPAQRIPRHEQLLNDPSLPPESRATVERHLNEEKQRAAIDNWIDKKLNRYIKNEMGTPEDPVRKLADQGITHLARLRDRVPSTEFSVAQRRAEAGFPAVGYAETALGQNWERATDRAIIPNKAGDYLGAEQTLNRNPWLQKLPEDAPVYEAGAALDARELGFDHLIDVLKEDLATGRIRPEQLEKMSMEQAVRRAHQYDQEMAEKAAKATAAAREGLPVYKEYPQGYRWIELNKPGAFSAESDSMGHSVRGYEPPPGHPDWTEGSGEAGSLYYGHGGWEGIKSGRAKVYSLVDSKGSPHVTIEIARPQARQGFIGDQRPSEADYYRLQEEWLEGNKAGTVDPNLTFAQWWRSKEGIPEPEIPFEITQIKGKQNRAPKEDYLPFVQDFVKSGQWSDVRDMQNTGLFKVTQGQRLPGFSKEIAPGFYTIDDFKRMAQENEMPQEIQDAWFKKLKDQSRYGYKKGGSVRISDNPDTMRLELATGGAVGQERSIGSKLVGGGVRGAGMRAIFGMDLPEDATKAEREVYANVTAMSNTPGPWALAAAPAALVKGAKGAKAVKAAKEEAERSLPLILPRAPAKSKEEIAAHAERVGRQMLGEHVTSGKPGDTKNLAGRSRKENERIKRIEYELEAAKKVPESQVVQPQIGDINVAFPGDYTLADTYLKTLGGEPIGALQQGGSRYGLGKLDMKNPLFWASNEGPAQMVQNKVTEVANLFEPNRVLGQHLAMGRVANNFAQHFADASLRAIDYSKMSRNDMNLFDTVIAAGYEKKNPKTGERVQISFPEWPGIADPAGALAEMKKNPELRKWFLSRMKTPELTQATNMPNGLDIEWAITSPDLRNMEVNLTGHSIGELVPGAKLTDDAAHETYSKGIRGRYLGHQEALTPFVLSFPDATQHIMRTQRPQDFTGTIQKVFPHQIVDQQYLDELGEYKRRLDRVILGKKNGGAVKKQAGGAIRRAAANAITKAAEDAGMKAPVTAAKDLTTLQDFHTSLRDRIQAEAEATRKMMEGFDYKYDKGQRVFTEDSARKNKAPYEILFRTRVGNQIMYDTSGGGMKQIKDPETGKAKRTPYEPGYRVRSQTEDGVSEFEIPQRAIKGNVEMAKGGRVKFTDNLDAMRLAVQKRK
jgi:hypothetical protein